MPTQHSPSEPSHPFHSTMFPGPKQSSLDSFVTATPISSQKTKRARGDEKSPENISPKPPMSVDALATLLLPKLEKLEKLELLDEINSNVAQIKVQLHMVEEKVESLEGTVASQAAQIASLIKEKDKLQDELRRSNLLVHGLPETETDQKSLQDTITALFQDNLGIVVEIDNPYRLGKFIGKNRPVKIRFPRLSHRSAVFEKRQTLRNSACKIAITEDLTEATRLERKAAWERRNKSTPNTVGRSSHSHMHLTGQNTN